MHRAFPCLYKKPEPVAGGSVGGCVIDITREALRGQRAIWHVEPPIPPSLCEQLPGMGVMIPHLLYCRGYDTAEKIRGFFTGGPVHHDPRRLPAMDSAVDRLARAVAAREQVAVYGDFDCDGITAAAVLRLTLRALGLEPIVHIPNREDGHGLSPEGLAALADQGTTLVLTADCGVTAIEEVRVAQGMGMDVIVTDHHLPRLDGTLPDCPVVSPTRQDADYPCRFLCGVGVAYKLAQALADRFPATVNPADLLDLVALGTIADVVPLRDENRSLVIEGLKRLRATSRPGLLALFAVAGIEPRRIDPTAVAFYLAPRINAANRLASPRMAYELIAADDPERAQALAAELSTLNQQRQLLVAEHFQQIVAELGDPASIAQEVGENRRPPILIVMGDWPSGISGLLASRLVETYGLPAFAAADAGNGLVAVSARGVPGVQIDELLEGCEAARPGGLFVGYGGHSRAGGFRVAGDRFALARELLEDQARRQVTIEEVGASLTVDAEVSFGQLTLDAALLIRALAPFGVGFLEPLFLARRVMVRRMTRLKEKHSRLSLQQNGRLLEGVYFNAPSALFDLEPEAVIDIVFNFQLDEWNGMLKPQLCIRDWRFA